MDRRLRTSADGADAGDGGDALRDDLKAGLENVVRNVQRREELHHVAR